MRIQENMAAVLRRLQQERQMTITEFAEVVDISRSSMIGYLTGRGNPRLDTLAQMAERLQIEVIEFFVPSTAGSSTLRHPVLTPEVLSDDSQTRLIELLTEMLALLRSTE